MIRIDEIQVSGESKAGAFGGEVRFNPGLNVISAANSHGKSLLAKSFAWCLGLEPIYGLQNFDVSMFPSAVRDQIDLGKGKIVPVLSSEAQIVLTKHNGESINIERAIRGRSPEHVKVTEYNSENGATQESVLLARTATMKDSTGGFQRFFFQWAGLPRQSVVGQQGKTEEVYLENLAPLFLIDQVEGWSDLQALQVHRYRQQDISQVAFEFLLGAEDALQARIARQQQIARESQLKAEAQILSQQAEKVARSLGCPISFSSHGSVPAIARRWGNTTLHDEIARTCNLNLTTTLRNLATDVETSRKGLTSKELDSVDRSASSVSSQKVVELKDRRHDVRVNLRRARRQLEEQRQLVESIEGRIQSSGDVLRLKTSGVGRIEQIECPTCHRAVDAEMFQLTEQSKESVEAFIDALKRERVLFRANIKALETEVVRTSSLLSRIEQDLADAERELSVVNMVAGSAREQIGQIASELASTERKYERVKELVDEQRQVQESIDRWLERALKLQPSAGYSLGLTDRINSFCANFRSMLRALGHSEITDMTEQSVRIDEDYVPYLGPRRLRSLGSASDQARLIAAYVLALARTGMCLEAPHPGIVLLDEPLQQNPDTDHREKIVDFLAEYSEKDQPYQLIVLTHLNSQEIEALAHKGVRVQVLHDRHLLRLADVE